MLHVRDLFTAVHDRGLADVQLEEIVRPGAHRPRDEGSRVAPAGVPPHEQPLRDRRRRVRRHGGHRTLEDLLEEIVGEIEDEFDVAEEQIEQIDEDTYRIDGMFPIDEFNERFGTDLPDEDFHTVGGFVFGQLGRAPQPGDDVVVERHALRRARGRRQPHREDRASTFHERPQPRRADDDPFGADDDLE